MILDAMDAEFKYLTCKQIQTILIGLLVEPNEQAKAALTLYNRKKSHLNQEYSKIAGMKVYTDNIKRIKAIQLDRSDKKAYAASQAQ